MTTYEPKFCKTCIELDQPPLITLPTKVYCREHYNQYQRELRKAREAAQAEYLKTHNEYGEVLDEFGLAPSDYTKETERLEEMYGED